MGLGSLRRFDVQANYARVLAIIAVFPLIGSIFLVWRNYHPDVRQIIYAANSYALALLACIGSALLLGGVACILGWNSAGQRINEKQGRSWFGFFVGGAVVTSALILLIAFAMLRLHQKN